MHTTIDTPTQKSSSHSQGIPFPKNEAKTTKSQRYRTVSSGMEEMPSLNMPIHRLKLAVLPLDLPCFGLETHSGEIPTTCKSHNKKKDDFQKT